MSARCDLCGKFHRAETGASWVAVPSCDIPGESGDERDRCRSCTEEHGAVQPTGRYRLEMVCGVYGAGS